MKRETILALREQGLSYREIERQTGCCRSLISYYCSKTTKDKSLIRQREGRAVIRARFTEYKVQKGCAVCGEKHPAVLDFHHIDASTKSFSVGSFDSYKGGWDVVYEEIMKCIVMCSNCHRISHYDEKKNALHMGN